jgi:hypothetical protein
MSFEELHSYFQVVRRRFREAETLEERLRLLAISKGIIREAEDQIAEFVLRLQR